MEPQIVYPLLVQVLLVAVLMGVTFRARVRAVRQGRVNIAKAAIDPSAWPPDVRRVANTFNNQFQIPLLFIAVAILAVVFRQVDIFFLTLAWLFVATRIVHAAIYLTYNDIRQRAAAFGAGATICFVMWLLLGWRIASATA
jgi:hypothetical protein